jgi:preprotein translocase subunit SecA
MPELRLSRHFEAVSRPCPPARVVAINALAPAMKALSDDQLCAKTEYLQAKVAGGASLEDVLAEAFAVVREAGASTRPLLTSTSVCLHH